MNNNILVMTAYGTDNNNIIKDQEQITINIWINE